MAQNLTIRLARSINRLQPSCKTVERNLQRPRLSSPKISHMDGNGEFACDAGFLWQQTCKSCCLFDHRRRKTVVTRAGRTSPEFRGQGIFKLLQQAIVDFSLKRYPIIQKWRLVTVLSPEMLDNSYENVDEQDSLTCMVLSSTNRPPSISFNLDLLEIQPCTKEYVCNVIFQKEVEKLLLGKLIQADRFPIEPSLSNINYLMQENDSLYFAVEKCVHDGCHPRSFNTLSL